MFVLHEKLQFKVCEAKESFDVLQIVEFVGGIKLLEKLGSLTRSS